jgi:hypothetical protein
MPVPPEPLAGGHSSYYVRGNGFATAYGVNTFVGLGFQVNRLRPHAKRFCEGFTHSWEVRAELGFFGDDDSIHVLDCQKLFIEKFARVFEEHQAVRAFPLGIGVGEMRADIAERGGSKQRVANRVGENITIGMTDWTFVEGDDDAANDERTAFGKTVEIVANAASEAHIIGGRCRVSP